MVNGKKSSSSNYIPVSGDEAREIGLDDNWSVPNSSVFNKYGIRNYQSTSTIGYGNSYPDDIKPFYGMFEPEKKEDKLLKKSETEILPYTELTTHDGKTVYDVFSARFTKDEFQKYFVDEDFTSEQLIILENQEQKRSILQHYGYGKIINKNNSRKIDGYTTISKITNEPIHYELFDVTVQVQPELIIGRVIKVEDHTTGKPYFLNVPRNRRTRNCKRAVAWLFGLKPSKYKPRVES
jgi:hypothetical protein